ncbi:hypothetical protein [Chthonobacter rhizosphaerae]|uniref:hypothetical protein n=1 Tax=Chthonobacter rhizosphaerae TaxID=2735553 RepID=UPI0015EF4A94|nr:hypothetical protein [Chthonobacter rhizosphaerae]
MKAALISVGYTEPQMRALGHKFTSLANACNKVGFGLNELHDMRVLEMIDTNDNYIKARYHYIGAFTVPTVQVLDNTACEIAVLAVLMVRKSGQFVRSPIRSLPIEHRYQVI